MEWVDQSFEFTWDRKLPVEVYMAGLDCAVYQIVDRCEFQSTVPYGVVVRIQVQADDVNASIFREVYMITSC